MKIEVSLASIKEKPILQNLMQLYLHDISETNNENVDDSGLFRYRHLDYYWTEPHRYPFLVWVDGELAGFVLLRKGTYFPDTDVIEKPGMLIAEFFVMRKYRQRGVGTQVAIQLFDRFPGRWEVAQKNENKIAQVFWRRLIVEYSEGNFTEFILDDE
jgi:predicted acetyltransferase